VRAIRVVACAWSGLLLIASLANSSCGPPARPPLGRESQLSAEWQPGPPAELPQGALLQEERRFAGPTGTELWRLYWTSEPRPRCASDPELSARANCACEGFANGLSGPMVLTRIRQNYPTEYLNIGGLFSDIATEQLGGDAMIAGAFAPLPHAAADATPRQRSVRPLLNLGDYNRDGIAAEFVLHTSNEACGHGRYLLVGLLAREGSLMAQTDVTDAREPLLAFDAAADWEALRATGRVQREYWRCFDQGSEASKHVRASAAAGRITAIREDRSCSNAPPTL
jgi:hypothetical protein